MRLPLFPDTVSPVLSSGKLERSTACTRCELHTTTPAGNRCVPPDGDPGDILIVAEAATELDTRTGRPLTGESGVWLRGLLERVAPDRKVVYTTAVSCKVPRSHEDIEASAEACSPYLAQDIEDAQPTVILLLGPVAGISVLGSSYQPLSVRTGYGWCTALGKQPVPVFLLPSLSQVSGNRLIRKAFEEDLQKALAASPEPSLLSEEYNLVEDREGALEALQECQASAYIATDVETSGMMFEKDFRIECVAVSSENNTWVFSREVCELDSDVLETLVEILHTCDNTSWNGQYDYTAFECDPLFKSVALRMYCRESSPAVMNLQSDARIKRKLIEADARADLGTAANLVGAGGHKKEAHDLLKSICDELRKYRMSFQKTPTGKSRKPVQLKHIDPSALDQSTWDEWFEYLDQGFSEEKFAYRFMPKGILFRYCARDARTTWLLEHWCNERLIEDDGLATVWEEVSKPSMWAYCQMRLNGMPLDKGALQLFQQYLEVELKKVQGKIDGYKQGLNPASAKQVGEYFATIGIVPKRKTDGGAPSYSDDSLEEYKDKHPMVDLVLQYRELQKQLGTYAIGYSHFVRSDGRVHPSFLSDGTESGRASCQDPNLFNVSKGRTERKKLLADMLRGCFVCPPGWSFIEVDAGQIEIRGAAHLSGDQAMHEMLTSGVDFHMLSAKRFAVALGKDPDKVTDLDRDNAKTSNFAGIYQIPNQLGNMLADQIGVSKHVGKQLAEAMFSTYVRLRAWMDTSYARAWETGIVQTQWKGKPARRRPLWGMGVNPSTLPELEARLERKDKSLDLNAARATYNSAVQGSSVDVIASHLWPVHLWLQENTDGGQLILQVYDSIMVMVRNEDVAKTVYYIKQIMVEPLFGETPLTADAKTGQSWSTMQKLK